MNNLNAFVLFSNVWSDNHDNFASKGSFLNGRFVPTSPIRQPTSQFIVCTLGILKHLITTHHFCIPAILDWTYLKNRSIMEHEWNSECSNKLFNLKPKFLAPTPVSGSVSQSVGQWFKVSDFEIAIASSSLFQKQLDNFWRTKKCVFQPERFAKRSAEGEFHDRSYFSAFMTLATWRCVGSR